MTLTYSIVSLERWPAYGGDAARLNHTFQSGHRPHALLLIGPSNVTRSVALFIAQLSLCTGAVRPCGECENCIQFMAGTNPNWHEVVLDGASIKTQQIEVLQSFLQLRSHGAGPLVCFLPAMDTATPVASNRLLKTLEEPLADRMAILSAQNIRQVLPTIVSRCQVYRMSKGILNDGQEPSGIDATEGEELQNSGFARVSDRMVQWVEYLLQKSEPPILLADAFHQFEPSPSGESSLDILLSWLTDLMHVAHGEYARLTFPEFREKLVHQAVLSSSDRLPEVIRIVLDTKLRAGSHVVASLNIEQMCIRIRRVLDGLHGCGSPV